MSSSPAITNIKSSAPGDTKGRLALDDGCHDNPHYPRHMYASPRLLSGLAKDFYGSHNNRLEGLAWP